jgi:hypothetical protein
MERVPGQAELHKETSSQNKQQKGATFWPTNSHDLDWEEMKDALGEASVQ